MQTSFRFCQSNQKSENQPSQATIDKMLAIQMNQLRETYHSDCLNVHQLKEVLNVGESNAYEWLNKCPAIRVMNRRKVVPIVWVAYYLVTGQI